MTVRILTADPGEATARVARTCKRIDATAISLVTSEGERGIHVESSDEQVLVPGDPKAIAPGDVVEAAVRSKADLVHPGYASLEKLHALALAFEQLTPPGADPDPEPESESESESEPGAEPGAGAGADPEAVAVAAPKRPVVKVPRLLAAKASSLAKAIDRQIQRAIATEVEVRFVPGSEASYEKLADAIEAAETLGYPVRVRVSRSGVARSRRIDDEDQLFASWDEIVASAKAGGCGVMVEREIELARRVDVLIATDVQGESIALAETEIALAEHDVGVDLDESPSPELIMRADGEAVRLAIFESAARFAQAFQLVGLSSVRVFLDIDGHFFIAGLRAGLPRHHGTLEMVSGLDLVGIELALHAGEPIPDEVHSMQPSGHAFGASIRAAESRDAATEVKELRAPPQPQRKVRFDPSVIDGSIPAQADDGLLMRVTAFGPIRHSALLGLDRMLAEIDVPPIRTNARSLRGVLADESFRAGQYDASLAERLRYPR